MGPSRGLASRGVGTGTSTIKFWWHAGLVGVLVTCVCSQFGVWLFMSRPWNESARTEAAFSGGSGTGSEAATAGDGQLDDGQGSKRGRLLGKKPTVVLSTGDGLWNTGVWTGYGQSPQRTLAWAQEGIKVDTSDCDVSCRFTQQQEYSPDAIMMESVNHKKFLGDRYRSVPFPWPTIERPGRPLLINFMFEPPSNFPEMEDSEFMEHFDIDMRPSQAADVPLTMVCPWGRPQTDFLKMPDLEAKTGLVYYYNEHGIARQYNAFVRRLARELGSDMVAHKTLANAEMPPGVSRTAGRIDYMGKFHFVLVTEFEVLDDWIEAEWSQALLAGAVPIYAGAPNIAEYAPGMDSFIDLSEWVHRPPSQLISFLRNMVDNPHVYARYLAWKKDDALPPNFQQKLDQCVFYAECRVCREIHNRLEAEDV